MRCIWKWWFLRWGVYESEWAMRCIWKWWFLETLLEEPSFIFISQVSDEAGLHGFIFIFYLFIFYCYRKVSDEAGLHGFVVVGDYWEDGGAANILALLRGCHHFLRAVAARSADHLYLCMCVCVCVCVCVHMPIHMHIPIYIHLYIYIRIGIYTYIYTYTYT